MKPFILIYSFFTLFWILFFWYFNEADFTIAVGIKVTLLYVIFGFVFISVFLLLYPIFSGRKFTQLHWMLLVITGLNVSLILLNPGSLIYDFLG